MARVLLITYSGYCRAPSNLILDNGLANLAAVLKQGGHFVRIEDWNSIPIMKVLVPKEALKVHKTAKILLDSHDKSAIQHIAQPLQPLFEIAENEAIPILYERLKREIITHQIDIVGFKCWIGAGLDAVSKWTSRLKNEYPHLSIMVGGSACQFSAKNAAKIIGNFDVMITHEGEGIVLDIIDALQHDKDLAAIPGILYRDSVNGHLVQNEPTSGVDLDTIPAPTYDRDVYSSAGSNDKFNFVVLDESRGCPNQCHFCAHPFFSGFRRTKKIELILRDVISIQRDLATRCFRFAGSNTPFDLLMKFSEQLSLKNLKILFSSFLHMNDINLEQLPALESSGYCATFVGIETMAPHLQETATAKKIDATRSKMVFDILSQCNIFATGSFIYPLPFETPETSSVTKNFIGSVFGNNESRSAMCLIPCPFPNTYWWKNKDHLGFGFDEENYINKALMFRVKNMYPTNYQDYLPFSLNNRNCGTLFKDLQEFQNSLSDFNILWNISDDMALIATNLGISPRLFRDNVYCNLLLGDMDRLQEIVTQFNSTTTEQGALSKQLDE